MKSNSTCAFTLLEFFNATKDQYWEECLKRWLENTLATFCLNGKIYADYFPKMKLRRDAGVTPAFILVDVICDAAWFIPEFRKYLPKAEEIINYYWERRLPNGLIPYHDEGVFAHIDSQVDFSISIRRFAELSEKSEYKNRSIELSEKVISSHYTSEGYVTYSGIKPLNNISPKYNALLLKAFINLLTIDEPIYPQHYSLFKDR